MEHVGSGERCSIVGDGGSIRFDSLGVGSRFSTENEKGLGMVAGGQVHAKLYLSQSEALSIKIRRQASALVETMYM